MSKPKKKTANETTVTVTELIDYLWQFGGETPVALEGREGAVGLAEAMEVLEDAKRGGRL